MVVQQEAEEEDARQDRDCRTHGCCPCKAAAADMRDEVVQAGQRSKEAVVEPVGDLQGIRCHSYRCYYFHRRPKLASVRLTDENRKGPVDLGRQPLCAAVDQEGMDAEDRLLAGRKDAAAAAAWAWLLVSLAQTQQGE